MKYTNIATVLGWEETPESAEGLFLQPEEATVIDTAIANAVTYKETATQLAVQVASFESTVAADATTISTHAARILELETENARLGALPSGNGSNLQISQDETVGDKPVPSYLSDDNPANQWLDKRMKK